MMNLETIGLLVHLTGHTIISTLILDPWFLYIYSLGEFMFRGDNLPEQQTTFFFSFRRGNAVNCDVQMESKEEEPVLQQCNVATDNRNWKDTSAKATSLFHLKPRHDGAFSSWKWPKVTQQKTISLDNTTISAPSWKYIGGFRASEDSAPCKRRRAFSSGVYLATALAAVTAGPGLHLMSHASRQESTHWSISICFCASLLASFTAPGREEWRSASCSVSKWMSEAWTTAGGGGGGGGMVCDAEREGGRE